MRTNFDIEKHEINACAHKRLLPSSARAAGAEIKSQQDVDDHLAEITLVDKRRRANPVYDESSLRAGFAYIFAGVVVCTLSSFCLFLMWSQQITGPGWAPYGIAICWLLGVWATIAGFVVRYDSNLPKVLTGLDIEASEDLLQRSDERHRGGASPLKNQFSFLMLSSESALLMVLVLPLLADSLTPNAQLALTIPLAIAIGYLQLRLIQCIAHTGLGLRVRHKWARLVKQTLLQEAMTKAETIQDLYGDAIVHKWWAPRFYEYFPLVAWGLISAAVILGIASVRVLAGENGGLAATSAICMGCIAAVFFAIATASEFNNASLISDIATAKCVIARFRSRASFEAEMASLEVAYDAEVAVYVRNLRQGYEVATDGSMHGVPKAAALNFAFAAPPETATPLGATAALNREQTPNASVTANGTMPTTSWRKIRNLQPTARGQV